jgi:hypothetical protein
MSFFVFAKEPFFNDHEKAQSKLILDLLKSFYKDKPEYCYCLLNVPVLESANVEKTQFDILVLTRHSISIIEMKAKKGKLIGKISKNYGNDDLVLQYPSGEQEPIRVSQVEIQHSSMISRLDQGFRVRGGEASDLYRVDQYLLFRDPLDVSEFGITEPKMAKWLKVTTEGTFLKAWESAKSQQFTLEEYKIWYLAEHFFDLYEVSPDSYSMTALSIQNRIKKFLPIETEEIYKAFDYDMIRKTVLERLSEVEFHELLMLRRNIRSLESAQEERFKSLFNRLKLPYISYQRIEHYFLGSLLNKTTAIFDHTISTFASIPQAVQNMDLNDPIVPHLKVVNISTEVSTMNEDIKEIENILLDYALFNEMKIEKWGEQSESSKDIERVMLLLNICLKMEPSHE